MTDCQTLSCPASADDVLLDVSLSSSTGSKAGKGASARATPSSTTQQASDAPPKPTAGKGAALYPAVVFSTISFKPINAGSKRPLEPASAGDRSLVGTSSASGGAMDRMQRDLKQLKDALDFEKSINSDLGKQIANQGQQIAALHSQVAKLFARNNELETMYKKQKTESNDALLGMFFLKNSIANLVDVIYKLNIDKSRCRCRCLNCFNTSRFDKSVCMFVDGDAISSDPHCFLIEYITKELNSKRVSFKYLPSIPNTGGLVNPTNAFGVEYYDLDCDLVISSSDPALWKILGFGKRIGKLPSIDCPIAKCFEIFVKSLTDYLNEVVDEESDHYDDDDQYSDNGGDDNTGAAMQTGECFACFVVCVVFRLSLLHSRRNPFLICHARLI